MAGAGRPSYLLAVVELRYTSLVSMLTFVVLDWPSTKTRLNTDEPVASCEMKHRLYCRMVQYIVSSRNLPRSDLT